MLPATYQIQEAAVALIRCSRKDATQRMLGFLFTNWSDGNGQRLLSALQAAEAGGGAPEPAANAENPKRVTPRQLADTIRAGVKELNAPSDAKP